MIKQEAPSWCKDAIATERGWLNPETGEVLISTNKLENTRSYRQVINEIINGVPVKSEKKILTEETPIEEIIKPSRRTRRKTKKVELKKDNE